MTLAAALALALVYAHPAAVTVALVESAALAHGVPRTLLAAACWQESRLGTAPRYASLCGVRVRHVYVRDDVMSAHLAALSLARRRAECSSWPHALAAYRYGTGCGAADRTGYVRRTLALARRIERAGGAP